MSAQELFEALGYKREVKENEYIRYRKGEAWDLEIFFDLENKTYNATQYITYMEIDMEIDMELHMIIHQQLIELGWINEHTKIQ